ncbi:hypothetical protein LCGC14_1477120 [marine sediment metagenome]|uniref:Uncharacterized protein n=1 Tax=marine sediment metagenome TaxID=412755 RepID=A0A0F9JAN8_9ZZZZ
MNVYLGRYNPFMRGQDPLCGRGWFDEHRDDVSQTMIDSQTLTVSKDGRTSILRANYKVEDIKTALKSNIHIL